MRQIERGYLYEDIYLGVTVGALIFPHGTIMIDAPLRMEDARSWRSLLLNQRQGSNRLLVILDAHPDRTLGARTMECTILSHQNTAQVFRDRPMIFKGLDSESGALWETYSEAIGMRWAVPDITFSERTSLHWGGPEVILEYHSGPSIGAIWMIIPEVQLIFVGDAVVSDQPNFLADADLGLWIEGLDLLIKEYKHYQIISGRSGLIDLPVVREQRRVLKKILQRVERLADRGDEPEATEKLVTALLRGLSYPKNMHDLYYQRLKHGLFQYYVRHYGPSSSSDKLQVDKKG